MKTLFSKLFLGMMVVGFLAGCAGLERTSLADKLADEQRFGQPVEVPPCC